MSGKRFDAQRTHQQRPWLARTGALVFLALLGVQISLAPAFAAVAPRGVFTVSSPATRGGTDAYLAPFGQAADTQADSPPEPDTAVEFDPIAALTTMMNRQGVRSVGNLERVASSDVRNLTVRPEFVVDARVERAAAASAAASAVATVEAERAAEVAAEAQAEAEAAVAAALAADQADDEADARVAQAAAVATREAETAALTATQEAATAALTATQEAETAAMTAAQAAEASAAVATSTAVAKAAESAVREAETSAAAATAKAEAQAAAAAAKAVAAEESNRQFSLRIAMLLLALALLVGGFLGLRFWRNRKEPFVLKAIPASETAYAHA